MGSARQNATPSPSQSQSDRWLEDAPGRGSRQVAPRAGFAKSTEAFRHASDPAATSEVQNPEKVHLTILSRSISAIREVSPNLMATIPCFFKNKSRVSTRPSISTIVSTAKYLGIGISKKI